MSDFSPTQRVQIGDARITYLADGGGRVDPCAMFPNTRDDDWPADARDADGRIETSIGAFLVEVGDHRILVDGGIGPVTMEFPGFGPFSGGALLGSLAAAGATPADLTHVVYTHLHVDHVGWTTDDEGALTFSNAAHLVSEAEWNFWRDTDAGGGPTEERLYGALADRIAWVADGDEIVPGFRAMATPGHTPGHTSYIAEHGDVQVVLLGDVLHHRRQLDTPGITCAFDVDPALAMRTRSRLLRHLEQPGTTLAAGHFTSSPFGRLTRGPTGLLMKQLGQRL